MRRMFVFLILGFLIGMSVQCTTAIPKEMPFKARIYVGWEEGYLGSTLMPESTWLVVKWSKDWNMPAFGFNSPEGAWMAIHFMWYTNNINEGFFGYDEDSLVYWGAPNIVPEAKYRVEEYVKIMILDETEKYEEKGAFKASDLGYPFPENAYVVHYTVEVYNATSNSLLFEYTLVPLSP